MRGFFGFCVVFFSVCILSTSMFVPVSLSAQPPIDTTTFYEGTIGWGPFRADPQRVYDTGSGQLVFNVYETLIAWDHESYYTFIPRLATNVPTRQNETKTITNTSFVNATTIYDATWSDGSVSRGFADLNSAGVNAGFSVGDVIYLDTGGTYRAWFVQSMVGTYTLGLIRYWYTFNIRTTPTINFINESGTIIDTFDIDDAEFTFKRGLVQDTGPQWMFYTAMFGTYNSAAWDSNDTARMNAIDQAHLIDSAVEKSGSDLTLNLGMPYPDNAFKQCLSSTWGSVGSKSFFLNMASSLGYGWNGDLYTLNSLGYPAWHNVSSVWHKSRSPLDNTGSLRWAGTGPYYVGAFDQPGLKIDLVRNNGYWGGWPAAGCNDSIATYEIQFIADWTTRRTAFLAGDIDTCAVPYYFMFELLQAPNTSAEPILIGGKPVIKTIKNLFSFSLDNVCFTFTLNSTCPYIGSGHFPDGIPLDFFNNTHVRKAFAYSVDRTQWLVDTYYGEAMCPFTPLIEGLYPDYRTVTSGYDKNFTLAEAELKSALFGGQNVWDTGFILTLVFFGSATPSRIMCEMIRDFFNTLSTYNGRTGPPFTINLVGTLDWATYLDYWEDFKLPLWSIGWLADFADADNFLRPYMRSDGDFVLFQNYTLANGWGNTHGTNYPTLNKDQLIDLALVTPDGPDRAKMYADLENIYMNDCPSFPVDQLYVRRWCQYWVKGWYYNALYPSSYFYTMWKQDDCWYDSSGPTIGVSDGVVNMRDLQYLIMHFNAIAPRAGMPVDPRWVGVYGANGAVDPGGDRMCNMRDIQGAIIHFNHKMNTNTP
jgi:peptide/nickel transport system substrate-binding protein